MRISTTSLRLCPVLVCLCFVQRCYGAGHHIPTKVPSKNQTKLANGETEVHHRPKRGWIWNQFFVLEEHMGPDAQYVGKVGSFLLLKQLALPFFLFFLLPSCLCEVGYKRSKLFHGGRLPYRHYTCCFYLLMWKCGPHLQRCSFTLRCPTTPLMIMSQKNVLFSVIKECLSARLPPWEGWIKSESENTPLHQAIFELEY